MHETSSPEFVKSPGFSISAFSRPAILIPDILGRKMKVEVPTAIIRTE
jgi:hypothetical protein